MQNIVPVLTNPLKNKRCYLSGPIENDKPDHNWRDEPRKVLVERFGIELFDPFADPKQQWVPVLKQARTERDFETMAKIAKSFVRKDLAMVDRGDFLVAYLPSGLPTTGTHHEIINSNNAKKPTLLVCPQGKEFVPLWYYGFIPHEFMFGSWKELWSYLDDVDAGKHVENNRWAFTYGLV
jgi:hypothetical protein